MTSEINKLGEGGMVGEGAEPISALVQPASTLVQQVNDAGEGGTVTKDMVNTAESVKQALDGLPLK
ncbi:hypothetical protein [Streptomyces sp. CA-132043]|uniref:hypothetical protein n=1 Tax=Streptomyces sp. CA-132043 TaxID=3240048 RepID=UPI003D919A7A